MATKIPAGRRTVEVSIDTDPDNELGPVSFIFECTVSFDFTPAERTTFDYEGNPAIIEDFSLVSIHAADVLSGGHPTAMKIGEWEEATKAHYTGLATKAMELAVNQQGMLGAAIDYLAALEDSGPDEDWDRDR